MGEALERALRERDEFTPQTRMVTFRNMTYTQIEPTLAEALELLDAYMDITMETSEGRNVMRVRLRESEYLAAVCQRFFRPPIDVRSVPARYYPELRALVDDWERWAGITLLRDVLRGQANAG